MRLFQSRLRTDVQDDARTEEDGKVHVVVATVYDSLELMYGDLCLDLELHARSGTFKYKKIKEEVLMDFL